jgi:mannose-6-phosphate isomerase
MTTSRYLREALILTPQYRDYVWGGDRLRPGHKPTAEAWVVYEQDLVASGPLKGKSLSDLAEEYGANLLGSKAVEQTGERFPLLIKLLDCADWLSLQVHPNDEQAARLEGPGFFGKTEAWYVVDADPGSELLAGLRPGTGASELEKAVRGGTILDIVHHLPVKKGDTIFISPGMIHALGPGLLIYEVQQTSDITYRVFDWNRPMTGRRKLHIEQSLEVIDLEAIGKTLSRTPLVDDNQQRLVTCAYFNLDLISGQTDPVQLDTRGESFHALTVLEGQTRIEGEGWNIKLERFETALIPADCGTYQLKPLTSLQVLRASVS